MNKEFKKNGFFVIKLKNKIGLSELRKRFLSNFNTLSKLLTGKQIMSDKDLIKLYHSKHRHIWTAVYDILKFENLLFKLAGNKEIIKLAKKADIKNPIFGTKPYVRVDMPNDPKYMFNAHQDYPYNKNSKNSIVIFIPLQKCFKKNGCLSIVKGSHKAKKVFSMDKNLIIKNTKKFKFIDVPLKFGEAVVFSQFLVHRSGFNLSDTVRFSVQLRLTDLAQKEYAKRRYFIVKR